MQVLSKNAIINHKVTKGDLESLVSLMLAASAIWPPSWDQFIPSIIATILGVFLPFLIQSKIEKYKEKKEHNKFVLQKKRECNAMLLRINEELKSISKKLCDVQDNTIEQNPLKTMVWNEALNTGLLPLMDTEIRRELFRVYEIISEFNSWTVVKTNFYFQHYNDETRTDKTLDAEIERLKEELLSQKDGIYAINKKIDHLLKEDTN